jgi:hypothetical protein
MGRQRGAWVVLRSTHPTSCHAASALLILRSHLFSRAYHRVQYCVAGIELVYLHKVSVMPTHPVEYTMYEETYVTRNN